jgi:hypothetical protein
MSPAVPLLEQAAAAVPLPEAFAPIVIADYGSSDGRNSLAPLAVAIRRLRDRIGSARAVSVVHTDLPANDFTALFQTLASAPTSYLRDDPAAFASAIGRSFYQQILPSCSVTLGWSAWAVQWLSRVPAPIPDHVQVACSRDPAARAAYARQAADDWRTFLAMRARELCPGGRLVVLTMAVDPTGDFGYGPLLWAMYAALVGLVDDGLVRPEEARRMAIPTIGRSRADLVAPFEGAGRLADLTIGSVDVFSGEDRIWSDFQHAGDARAFGARWAAFSRASVFPTLAAGLDGGSEDPRAPAFVSRMEAIVAAQMAASPEKMEIPLARMCLVKNA